MSADGTTQVGPTTPWRREPAELARGLARWATATGRGDISAVRAPASGMANETILFEASGRPLVARLAPLPGTPFPTFPSYDLDYQRRVMELVRARTAVLVPAVVHLEPSDEWLGAPFLVLEAVSGDVPGDNPPYVFGGWLADASPADRRRFEQSSVAALAQLHSIAADGESTAFLERDCAGATPLARELEFLRGYYEWAREDTKVPGIEAAFAVLGATMPLTGPSCLNWGDSRIGNVIYRDFTAVAILDWEMATVGPPEVDVGWMTFFHTFFQRMAEGYGFAGIPDLLERERVVATYESLTGRNLLDLGWFEALAALRFAIISVRTSLRSIAFGLQEPPTDPDDLVLHLPLLRHLLEEL